MRMQGVGVGHPRNTVAFVRSPLARSAHQYAQARMAWQRVFGPRAAAGLSVAVLQAPGCTGTPVHCMNAYDNAMQSLRPPRPFLVPAWERVWPTFTIGRPHPVGTTFTMAPPPPIEPAPPPVLPPAVAPDDSVLPPSKRRRIRWPKKPKTEEEDKAKEIHKWQAIIELAGPEACGLAGDLVKEPDDERRWRILEAVCHGKSSETLRKRSGAINLYIRWARTSATAPFPFHEHVVWNYVAFLHDVKAPATRAKSFIEAGHLTTELLSMFNGMSVFESPRIDGAVKQSFDRKRDTMSAPPFTVAAVEALERAIADEKLHATKRIAAGFARFCTGGRIRHGDGNRIDREPDTDPSSIRRSLRGLGFVEVTGKVTKTSQGQHRRRPIPMSAHSWGIVDKFWAAKWLRLRQKHGRDATTDGSLMPACGPDWVLIPGTRMSSDTMTTILREVLVSQGISADEAGRYTTHSMKTTFLSWAGKTGLPKSIRRALGGHSKPGDRMPDLYSRDSMAEQLRQLGHCLVWIAARVFLPDSTKSGRWVKNPREAFSSVPRGAGAIDTLKALVVGDANPDTIYAAQIAGAKHGSRGLGPAPDIADGDSDIELPPSDVEDMDSEDERRDAAEHRAAEVVVDNYVLHEDPPLQPTATDEGSIQYAPPGFVVLRHIFKGTRHWSKDGRSIVCPAGQHNFRVDNYRVPETHDDHMCEGCIGAVERRHSVVDARDFVHGKRV